MPNNGCSLETLQAIHLKVVEASPDAKIVINTEGKIIVFNTQAELMFGYDRSEVVGKTIEMLIPEDKRDIHIQFRIGYFEDPKTREMGEGRVLNGRHRTGMNFPVQIKLAPLIVPEAGVHTLAVVRRIKKEVK